MEPCDIGISSIETMFTDEYDWAHFLNRLPVLHAPPDRPSGPRNLIYKGYRGSFSGLKPTPSSAEVENE